jgi:hypothetical protein
MFISNMTAYAICINTTILTSITLLVVYSVAGAPMYVTIKMMTFTPQDRKIDPFPHFELQKSLGIWLPIPWMRMDQI